jgi:predicted DCC family thiol-disulfide oxidoreductase YuxK
VTTEIPDITNINAGRGWIFYDANCPFCVWGRNRLGRLLESRGFHWLPWQTAGAAQRVGVTASAFDTRMHLLTGDGRVRHNSDALAVMCRAVWWLWPLGMLLGLPGFRQAGRLGYDWFARHRHCLGGRCRAGYAPPARFRVGGWADWKGGAP